MVFQVGKKGRGRPKVDVKRRDFLFITPKGFKLDKVDMKKKELVFKRMKK